MYSTTWCGHCRRLKRELDEAGVAYEEVDVDAAPDAGRRIIERTGGYRVVPTVEVAGELLVNPPVAQVLEVLAKAR